MSGRAPGEQGLALERTRLAWRRTGLGLAAGSVAAGRLLQELVGPVAWVVTVLGLVAAALVVRVALRRYTGGAWRTAGGGLVAAVAVGSAVVGAVALLVVLAGQARLV
ncbi:MULTISPECIES: DUF202 domain-containing protein [Cellulomonas]|uniref:DUF202 domain-containing protein n=1 Tax=Cellulomonas uda TaxID=1714 RepID=A0A4Y3KDB0_CELUD|nr:MULTISPECIES: DUF202 domain-containing protein [Cellulomonas]NII66803.1 putative membrane protein [Cellulomonas uda]GEA81957.1 hypothetical protein CUD01_24010 [Cellulomonas uda]